MIRARATLCAALALAALLSGCVAAAIPVLAAGAMVRSGNLKIRAATPRPKLDRKHAAKRWGEQTRGAPAAGMIDSVPPSVSATGAEGDARPIALLPSDAEVIAALDPWRSFAAFAREQASLAGEPGKMRSVLLDPAAPLTYPKRRDCQTQVPAVVIDLDSTAGPFDPAQVFAGNAGLARHLAELRAAGIVVMWISALPAADVGTVATALSTSGLDPAGADPLLLIRSGSDRKQLLRQQANRDVCVIAIAGDRKGDFDELYDYLKDPAAPSGLDSLLGAGWFITPPPLHRSTE